VLFRLLFIYHLWKISLLLYGKLRSAVTFLPITTNDVNPSPFN
jgi:hypothetical protein